MQQDAPVKKEITRRTKLEALEIHCGMFPTPHGQIEGGKSARRIRVGHYRTKPACRSVGACSAGKLVESTEGFDFIC